MRRVTNHFRLHSKKNFKMAASKSSKTHSITLAEDELCCPVCYDELEDPKAFPECLHDVCKKCLEEIALRNRGQFVECPICREKSFLPPGGVDELPTHHLMKRLVDGIPGRKEKLALEKALNECQVKVDVGKSTLESINRLIIEARENDLKQAEDIKTEISEHAGNLIEAIKNQEKKLYLEVDDLSSRNERVLELKNRKEKLSKTIKQTEDCINNVSQLLRNNCLDDIKDLKDVLVIQFQDFMADLVVPKTILHQSSTPAFKFESNKAVFSEQILLGRLSKQETVNINKDEVEEVPEPPSTLSLDLEFEPLSIAISQSENGIFVGILRSNEKQFELFDIHGNQIKSVRLDDVPASHLYDVNLSIEDDRLLVLDRLDKQLLHYSLDGRCIKETFLKENVKFISMDYRNRVILTTSRDTTEDDNQLSIHACSVLVFYPNKDELELKFGEQNLVNPSGRTVFHQKSFFVPDNYSELKLFNERGIFIKVAQLNGINPSDYNIFSIDVYKGSIIACNTKKKVVKIYSILDLSLISSVNTPDVPWMIEALPSTKYGTSVIGVINESTRLDIIGYM